MPEGDTIHRAAQTLDRALGRTAVTRFESVLPSLTRVDEDHPIAGRTVERVESAGKFLLVRFSGDLILLTHMRMSGSWHIYRHGEPWRKPRSDMRVVIETGRFVAVAFTVPVAELHTARSLARREGFAGLGQDLLGDEFDLAAGAASLRRAGTLAIADALIAQRLVAGAGNVYKSEVLFVARVNPFTPVADLPDEALRRILATARTLMQANVRAGAPAGIVTYSGFRRTTRRGDPSARLWVYGRQGRPCRACGAPIQSRRHGPDARSTYWCPRCQAST
jgi:endonuclease-8